MAGSCRAHEFHDTPEALKAKVKLLAHMLRRATHSVVYTGAGISTAAGISDYASKAGARSSVLPKQPSGGTPFAPGASIDSEPTFAHKVLVALHSSGLLRGGWVQQNHDALAQKAGFPQEDLIEIHGGWFDPSNPVVPMEGSLRTDLVRRLKGSRESADLVIVMGTSLSGVSADQLVSEVGRKRLLAKETAEHAADKDAVQAAAVEGEEMVPPPPLGAVIVNIQQTRLDHLAALRIFATCDEVARLLAVELGLELPPGPRAEAAKLKPSTVAAAPRAAQSSAHQPTDGGARGRKKDGDVWRKLPYNAETGCLLEGSESDDDSGMTLDLRCGQRVRLARGNAPMAPPGIEGVVAADKTAQGHYRIEFSKEGGETLLCHLGTWMLEAATEGRLDMLPLIPCDNAAALQMPAEQRM